jgi:hypothetical protein
MKSYKHKRKYIYINISIIICYIMSQVSQVSQVSKLLKDELHTKMTNVKNKLNKMYDYEIDSYDVFNNDVENIVNKVYPYIINDFTKYKNDIRNHYSQENIEKYVSQLSHTYHFILSRYPRDAEVTNNMISKDLTILLEKYFYHNIYNFCDEIYCILLDNYSELNSWSYSYVKNYSIIIAFYIIERLK